MTTLDKTSIVIMLLGMAVAYAMGRLHGAQRAGRATQQCGAAYCEARSDPRCAAGNCTYHCQGMLGCNERCLDAWEKSEAAQDVAKRALERAR